MSSELPAPAEPAVDGVGAPSPHWAYVEADSPLSAFLIADGALAAVLISRHIAMGTFQLLKNADKVMLTGMAFLGVPEDVGHCLLVNLPVPMMAAALGMGTAAGYGAVDNLIAAGAVICRHKAKGPRGSIFELPMPPDRATSEPVHWRRSRNRPASPSGLFPVSVIPPSSLHPGGDKRAPGQTLARAGAEACARPGGDISPTLHPGGDKRAPGWKLARAGEESSESHNKDMHACSMHACMPEGKDPAERSLCVTLLMGSGHFEEDEAGGVADEPECTAAVVRSVLAEVASRQPPAKNPAGLIRALVRKGYVKSAQQRKLERLPEREQETASPILEAAAAERTSEARNLARLQGLPAARLAELIDALIARSDEFRASHYRNQRAAVLDAGVPMPMFRAELAAMTE